MASDLRLGVPTTVHALRKGMWVVLPGGSVGIVVQFKWLSQAISDINSHSHLIRDLPCAEVHIVNQIGRTVLQMPAVPVERLRQARYEDIPPLRRPSQALAARLGYL